MDKNIIWKFLAGELSSDEAIKLMHWVSLSDENKKMFSKTKLLWMASKSFTNEPTSDQKEDFARLTARIDFEDNNDLNARALSDFTSDRKPAWQVVFKVAAVILLIYCLSVSFIIIKDKNKKAYTQVTTRKGKQSEVILADGTHIWLNSESSIKYPVKVNGSKVNVFLNGEAYFEVHKNPNRKFIVNTGEIKIAVLGTSFNVKAYDDEETIETTLEEGKISISGKIAQKQLSKPIILEPNQRIIFNRNSSGYKLAEVNSEEQEDSLQVTGSASVELTLHAETRLYTSWKDGVLSFKNERFEVLAEKMERWFNVRIIIESPELKETRYTGVFEKESIERALKALSMSLPFKYEIDQDIVTIKQKRE
jgi:transmembrane sensor